MVLQEFKGCGHNTHLILALLWSKRLSCTRHRLQFSPTTLGRTQSSCGTLLYQWRTTALVTSGPPTEQAFLQLLTRRPCASPASSSSPSLPVSELGEGGWVPSGSSSLVELTMDTLRTGPYRSNTAHTFWEHKTKEIRSQHKTSNQQPTP